MLQAFGEPVIKAFVQEGVNEALKLEAALGQLDVPMKVVLMHYAPMRETTAGEQVELPPFLGTTRLSAPSTRSARRRYSTATRTTGRPRARRRKGIPVFNVAMPVLKNRASTCPRLAACRWARRQSSRAQPTQPQLIVRHREGRARLSPTRAKTAARMRPTDLRLMPRASPLRRRLAAHVGMSGSPPVPERRGPRGLADALQDLVHPDRLRDVALRAEELGLPLEPVGGEDQDRDGGALRGRRASAPSRPSRRAPAS